MVGEGKFDFLELVSSLRTVSPEDRRDRVLQETSRVKAMVIRENAARFEQQVYLKRLQRLARVLGGDALPADLTPSEKKAYASLFETKEEPVSPVAQPPAAEKPSNRRVHQRLAMGTTILIRKDATRDSEVLHPLNVSRGGVGFESSRQYALHEIIWVALHYSPDTSRILTRSQVVRAVPIPQRQTNSYGVKFLEK